MATLPTSYGPSIVLGDHTGSARRLARGLRAACRPVPAPWADDIADSVEVRRVVCAWIATIPVPDDADVVTWVPGHDGTPGPGHRFAVLVGEAWSLPVEQLVDRRHRTRSALMSTERPTVAAHRASLAARSSNPRRPVLVDNTIASGASITATAAVLASAGHHLQALIAVTSVVAR